jgi:hypothetical protein
VQEPQIRLTPPLRRAPPGQNTGIRQAHLGGEIRTPDFDAIESVSTPQQRTPNQNNIPAERFWNVFLIPT